VRILMLDRSDCSRIRRMSDTEPAALRLFLALWPPREVHAALRAHAQQWAWTAQARRTLPERLHVTIHFLGNVPAARLAELRSGLQVNWHGEELVLDAAHVWAGGIAALEASRVPPGLAALHAALADRLRSLELPVDARPWRPHVTLARKAAGAQAPEFEPLRWPAMHGYALVRSVGGGGGYTTLQSFA
jgi:2'-5' RNA ligase